MKPCAFDYIRAETLDDALSVLAENDLDVKIMAGGQSLLPMLNMRLARPQAILDINNLPALETLDTHTSKDGSTMLDVGALVRQRQLEYYAAREPRARLLHAALLHIGHPQTRNQGTVGGSLAHADASAELPLLFLTLGGTALLQSAGGKRTVAAEDFFLSHFTTVIEPDELLTGISWHLPTARTGMAFKEFRRRHGDFAVMAAACTMALDEQRVVRTVRLGLGGVAETPILIEEAQTLIGEQWSYEHGALIADQVIQRLSFIDDAHISADYRQQLVRVILTRVLGDAFEDAQAKEALHA